MSFSSETTKQEIKRRLKIEIERRIMKEVLLREEKRKKEEAEEKKKQRALDEQLALTQRRVQESLQKQAEALSVMESER